MTSMRKVAEEVDDLRVVCHPLRHRRDACSMAWRCRFREDTYEDAATRVRMGIASV